MEEMHPAGKAVPAQSGMLPKKEATRAQGRAARAAVPTPMPRSTGGQAPPAKREPPAKRARTEEVDRAELQVPLGPAALEAEVARGPAPALPGWAASLASAVRRV
jgi:hypothetical protein